MSLSVHSDQTERPLSDLPGEARRLAALAAESAVALRVTGGAAVWLRCPSAAQPPLSRNYADIDLVGRARDRRSIIDLLERAGYEPNRTFNALHGARRLYFWDDANGRQLDVFLDRVEMCHDIDLSDRLENDPLTLTLADLLLLKLQIFETNEKDFLDVVALLADHPLTPDDAGINLAYISALAADDWGLWNTIRLVARKAREFVGGLPHFPETTRVTEAFDEFERALTDVRKSRKWKLRARVGERKRWYELPEEVR